MNVIEPIRHGLTNLLTFNGRDSRTTFWFYVLFLVVIYFAISTVFGLVMGGAMVMDGVKAVSGGRGHVDEAAMQLAIRDRMVATMHWSLWLNVAMSLVGAFALAAAFTRRLHDCGKSGWIAGITVGLKILATIAAIGMIREMTEILQSLDFSHPEALQAKLQAQRYSWAAVIGWIPLLLVVGFGLLPSNDGDNRYGPEPDDY